jgi:hypothetical protein
VDDVQQYQCDLWTSHGIAHFNGDFGFEDRCGPYGNGSITQITMLVTSKPFFIILSVQGAEMATSCLRKENKAITDKAVKYIRNRFG